MSKRQKEERFLPNGSDAVVVPVVHSFDGQGESLRILSVCLRGVPIHGSRELIEDYDQRQSGARSFGPVVKLASCRSFQKVREPLHDGWVSAAVEPPLVLKAMGFLVIV